jgi:hypothetical protein
MTVLQNMTLWRDANRLLVQIEESVSRFPRYHKYALGTDLRRQAMGVCRLIVRAVATPQAQRRPQVQRLVHAIDDLKVLIQLAKEVKAFNGFAEFERLVDLAVAIGRQSGAWLRNLGPRPESPGASR